MTQYSYSCDPTLKDKIILDTNSFYDFLGWAGVSFDGAIRPQTNTHVIYEKLNKEFDPLLKANKIALSNVLLFEVISHFRDQPIVLSRILQKIL